MLYIYIYYFSKSFFFILCYFETPRLVESEDGAVEISCFLQLSCRPSKGHTKKEQDGVLLIAKETSILKRRITNVKSNTWIHVTSTQSQGFIHNILSVSHSLSFLHFFFKRHIYYYNLLMEIK
jgi:hypothetical protein